MPKRKDVDTYLDGSDNKFPSPSGPIENIYFCVARLSMYLPILSNNEGNMSLFPNYCFFVFVKTGDIYSSETKQSC